MRLREPFAGYKLSQGHFMFHIAYLVGSFISCRLVLDPKSYENKKDLIVKGVTPTQVLN